MIETKNRIIRDDFDIEKYRCLTEERKKLEDYSACNEIPLKWDSARDYYVFCDGNKFIDMTSGIFVANAGHANNKIKQAIIDCVNSNLLFSFNYNIDIRIEFIKYLLSISPSYFNKAILMNSGSEAMEIAYRLIKTYGKTKNRKYIISFRDSYHGRGLAGCLLSRNKKYSKWSGIDDDIIFLDGDIFRKDLDCDLAIISEEIAGIVIETYRGWDAKFLGKDYMKSLFEFAKKYDILVCFDEIQSGFYRTGKLYGYQHYGDYLKPDIICLGKGISSSLPLAAVLSRDNIVDVDMSADLSGTHPGDPICLSAALANLEFLQEEKFQKKLKKRIEVFAEIKRLEKYSIIKEVNVRGMVAAIVFQEKEIADKVVYDCISKGVLPVYTYRNSVKLGPPLTINLDVIREAFSVIERVIKNI